jgi:ATP-dependent exoDNAse (exonuclease V) alpha subunit
VFEEGQAYVALSRCRDLSSLFLIGKCDPNLIQKAIRANKTCVAFYEALEEKENV